MVGVAVAAGEILFLPVLPARLHRPDRGRPGDPALRGCAAGAHRAPGVAADGKARVQVQAADGTLREVPVALGLTVLGLVEVDPSGALVGLIAGLYPALRAARMRPVDASRSGT